MKWMGLVALACMAAMGQAIFVSGTSPRNAASGGMEIAPGSIFEIPGTVLGLTEVLLNGRPLLRVTAPTPSDWAVIPEDAAPGIAELTFVTSEGRVSTLIGIRASAPGLFAKQGRSGPALSTNSLTNPAVAGQFVTLWGTGLGNARDVFVDLAGQTVRAQHAERHPNYPGLDQINFQVPQGAWLGCYVPVSIRVGDAVSNTVTLSIGGSPGACPHPLGLSYADLVTLDHGGRVATGLIQMPFVGFTTGRFARRNADEIYRMSGMQMPEQQRFGCSVSRALALGFFLPGLGLSSPLDAGLGSFTSPSGANYPVAWNASINDLELTPGPWLVSGSGGRDIGPFQHPFAVPPLLRLNRADLAVIDSNADEMITWDPMGYSPTDIVTARLAWGTGTVTCNAYAWTGRITLPREMVASLRPPIPIQIFPPSLAFGIEPHPLFRPRFEVPLTSGGRAPVVIEYSLFETLLTEVR